MKKIILFTAMVLLGFSCSKDDNDVNYPNQGTMDNPVPIEAEIKITGTVSGNPKSSEPNSSYYVFTAPENGYYSIIIEDMVVAQDRQDVDNMVVHVAMSHVSDPVETATYTSVGPNNTGAEFLGKCWKGAQYVITITNENTNYTDGSRSFAYPKKFDFKVYKSDNKPIEGSMENPVIIDQYLNISNVGECYVKFFNIPVNLDFEHVIYNTSSEEASSDQYGLAVENIKIEIFKNNFQQESMIKSFSGKANEMTFNLDDDFLRTDTAYLHIYSPDNRYWGRWEINFNFINDEY